jgi:hypothetical protein
VEGVNRLDTHYTPSIVTKGGKVEQCRHPYACATRGRVGTWARLRVCGSRGVGTAVLRRVGRLSARVGDVCVCVLRRHGAAWGRMREGKRAVRSFVRPAAPLVDPSASTSGLDSLQRAQSVVFEA